MFVIAVVLQWPQIMPVCGVAEGVRVGEGVGDGDGLAFALETQSVAVRQAQTTAATLGRVPPRVFAVRLLLRIGMEW